MTRKKNTKTFEQQVLEVVEEYRDTTSDRESINDDVVGTFDSIKSSVTWLTKSVKTVLAKNTSASIREDALSDVQSALGDLEYEIRSFRDAVDALQEAVEGEQNLRNKLVRIVQDDESDTW